MKATFCRNTDLHDRGLIRFQHGGDTVRAFLISFEYDFSIEVDGKKVDLVKRYNNPSPIFFMEFLRLYSADGKFFFETDECESCQKIKADGEELTGGFEA